MKIIITGANGLLGQKIVRQCIKNKIDFLATSQGENRNSNCQNNNYHSLDITSKNQIDAVVRLYNPTHIINTAAITNVDYCENHVEECQHVNVSAVELLFDVCKKNQIHFTQLSTDFVFDGEDGPYEENDIVNPLSVYAKSKVDSETILKTSPYANWVIVRTIIVYGEGENLSRSNIVLWAKGALLEGKSLTIVDDQFSAPTWADDLAWACLKITKLKATGVYHISGPILYSIYELVCKIADFYECDKSLVQAIKSNTLNQKAKRPPKTGFILTKSKKVLGYEPKNLEDTLKLIQ